MNHHSSITSQNVLSPAIVRTIHEAFDDVMKTLETCRGPYAPHASQRVRAGVARQIVELAKHGECNFDHLRDHTLKAFHCDP